MDYNVQPMPSPNLNLWYEALDSETAAAQQEMGSDPADAIYRHGKHIQIEFRIHSTETWQTLFPNGKTEGIFWRRFSVRGFPLCIRRQRYSTSASKTPRWKEIVLLIDRAWCVGTSNMHLNWIVQRRRDPARSPLLHSSSPLFFFFFLFFWSISIRGIRRVITIPRAARTSRSNFHNFRRRGMLKAKPPRFKIFSSATTKKGDIYVFTNRRVLTDVENRLSEPPRTKEN